MQAAGGRIDRIVNIIFFSARNVFLICFSHYAAEPALVAVQKLIGLRRLPKGGWGRRATPFRQWLGPRFARRPAGRWLRTNRGDVKGGIRSGPPWGYGPNETH